ncbi:MULTISPECIES: BcsE family c-di-GMP-binding protein [Pseudomonadaceae]|uniref:Protease n=1 Tax=Stutzerimonas stutzeri TaxID=316 RepID=A0A0D9AG16_STUST|nr:MULTISPECIES: BcsE family c-di-GMP-binding protein [Pseudomonadaceae]KJH79667.1 protease [Stutzerimonas stutzeri]
MSTTASYPEHGPASLGLDIDRGALTLSVGRVQWVIVEQASDAALLSQQVIEAFGPHHQAVLVSDDARQKSLLAKLPADSGPSELLCLTLASSHFTAFLKRLGSELDRAGDMRGRCILLTPPTTVWDRFGERTIATWLEKVSRWLIERQATLLVISDGVCDGLSERLSQLTYSLAGYASLNRTPLGPRLFLHFWNGGQGITSARELHLQYRPDGFRVAASSDIEPTIEYPDQGRIHAERSVLDGAQNLSVQWRLFENRNELFQHALAARAASVLFAITKNEQVEDLAHQLNQLRRSCGNQLKLIVREIAPCLRYRDEQLLLTSGASLVVPFGTSLPRFLTLVESVQGHLWQRQLKDIGVNLDELKPLPLCGQQSPLGFAEAVREMWPSSATGEIIHQLIRLQPVSGLSLQQVLSQTRLRRSGDIACIADKALHLFLFACRPESLEAALSNIFGVRWQELFVGLEQLTDLDPLSRPSFQSDASPMPSSTPVAASAGEPKQPFHPRPMRLSLEARP